MSDPGAEEVIVDLERGPTLYCFSCRTEMKSKDKKRFECPTCGHHYVKGSLEN